MLECKNFDEKGQKIVKRVITYGTFDLLHYGHIHLLRRAKQLGDYLIVGLSTDEFNEIKGKKAYFSYEQRKLLLESIKYVDQVIPEESWEQKVRDILSYNVDIFVMGDDWKDKFDFLNNYCEVVYLQRTLEISTTKIKMDIKEYYDI
ncbi:Glycerol-3-phosphate cytidylyltransferase [Anoxybacillus flavithermus WK1]|uniref:Glycerol-3-phosphate cytidylyltransferase n=1 Tax=Anoxybacillus flavithermus (strain DSM 21510 / WK1) TaxID=491915 RepID=B7GKZ1_ANOFW|nr:Glycerol-3-phosphate cytidylyltransferase [Anoxybacillus flavithermus WK1]